MYMLITLATPYLWGPIQKLFQTLSKEIEEGSSDFNKHEIQAYRMGMVGWVTQAIRIWTCKTNKEPHPGWKTCLCHNRQCPVCSKIMANDNTKKMTKAIKTLHPTKAVIASVRSKGLWDLAETIREFRKHLTNLRALKAFALTVRGGVGVIEPKLSEDGTCWAVHAHLAIGITDDFDITQFQNYWREKTNGRGDFKYQDKPDIDIGDEEQYARYACKPDTWSPDAGDLPLELFGVLVDAIYRKQLYVSWGPKK